MSDRLRELVERLGLLLRAEERRVAAELGIQPVQIQVLDYLDRCNAYSDNPAAVAEYLGATKGTISQSIQRLQEKDLIRSIRDEFDRRRIHLSLTAAGRALLRKAESAKLLDEALARFGPRGEVVVMLEELMRSIQGAQGDFSFGICRSCRHFHEEGRRLRCGHFEERLDRDEIDRICRDHEPR